LAAMVKVTGKELHKDRQFYNNQLKQEVLVSQSKGASGSYSSQFHMLGYIKILM